MEIRLGDATAAGTVSLCASACVAYIHFVLCFCRHCCLKFIRRTIEFSLFLCARARQAPYPSRLHCWDIYQNRLRASLAGEWVRRYRYRGTPLSGTTGNSPTRTINRLGYRRCATLGIDARLLRTNADARCIKPHRTQNVVRRNQGWNAAIVFAAFSGYLESAYAFSRMRTQVRACFATTQVFSALWVDLRRGCISVAAHFRVSGLVCGYQVPTLLAFR